MCLYCAFAKEMGECWASSFLGIRSFSLLASPGTRAMRIRSALDHYRNSAMFNEKAFFTRMRYRDVPARRVQPRVQFHVSASVISSRGLISRGRRAGDKKQFNERSRPSE